MIPALLLALGISYRVDQGPWVRGDSVSPLVGQAVRLRVDEVPGAEVRWFQIIPDTSNMYKNANFPWEEDAYKWVGLARIRCDKEEFVEARGLWEVEVPSDQAGSFWFQAEVEKDGKVSRSPGIEASDRRGLSPSVFRVSFREGPGFLGWMTSFFNVPALFGSIPYQSNNYIGADCADTLMAAYGKWTGKETERNYNVAMMVSEFPKVAEFDLDHDSVSKRIPWSVVRPGDWIAVRYGPSATRSGWAKTYQHIGALVADEDGDGIVSTGDKVLHAGPMPLAYGTLGSGPFDGHLAVLRPSSRIRDRPISFSEKRVKGTLEYIRLRYGVERQAPDIEPRMVVLHWTGIRSGEDSWRTFDKEALSADRTDIAAGGDVNVSAHFLVDKDGSITRLMPESRMARHVIGLNLCAIGIENVGGPELSEAQAAADAWLVRDLKDRFPSIEYLIGHHEYERFSSSPLWLEKDPSYRTQKSDPGGRFMEKVRAEVEGLGLKDRP